MTNQNNHDQDASPMGLDKAKQLEVITAMIREGENNLVAAKNLLQQVIATDPGLQSQIDQSLADDQALAGASKIIEGVFDGQNMMAKDGKQYTVPANYASKSKLVEGDVLKLTITQNGTFIYKQINPAKRKRVIGKIIKSPISGEYEVVVADKTYQVLLASVTYFKIQAGDEVVALLPQEHRARWAVIENAIHSNNPIKSNLDLP